MGRGKTTLTLALCGRLRDTHSIAVVPNDIVTEEDAQFLLREGALPPERMPGVETEGRVVVMATVQGLISAVEGGSLGLVEEEVIAEYRRRAIGNQVMEALKGWVGTASRGSSFSPTRRTLPSRRPAGR